MLERLIHEHLAREIGQPLLTLSSLNKIDLIWFDREEDQSLVASEEGGFSPASSRSSQVFILSEVSRTLK